LLVENDHAKPTSRGKERRRGRVVGRKPDWKKAYVTLKDGDKIEFFEGL